MSDKLIKLLHYRNATYQGHVKNNKRNGKGILITDNGEIIVGQWKNDLLYGWAFLFVNSLEYGMA
jgi:hypothetical protein